MFTYTVKNDVGVAVVIDYTGAMKEEECLAKTGFFEYGAGESIFGTDGIDYIFATVTDEDGDKRCLYAEVNPEAIPGAGHYDDDNEWVWDADACVSEEYLIEAIKACCKDFNFVLEED